MAEARIVATQSEYSTKAEQHAEAAEAAVEYAGQLEILAGEYIDCENNMKRFQYGVVKIHEEYCEVNREAAGWCEKAEEAVKERDQITAEMANNENMFAVNREIDALKQSLAEANIQSTLLQEEVTCYMAKYDPKGYLATTSQAMVLAGEMTDEMRVQLMNDFDRQAEASSAILQKNPTNDELCDTATSRAKYMRLASHEHRILALFVSGRRLLNRVC